MIYVEKVESSLKKGCDVVLSPRTLLVGPNGSGKSSVVQSIELASNGWASDMEGRACVKLPQALARLFPEGVRRFSKVTLSNGTTLEWELENGAKDGSYKRPEHNPSVQLRWPVQTLTEVLRGDVATVSSWLEQQVLGNLKESDIVSSMPPAVREIVRDFVRRQRKYDFIALAKEAKNEAKNLRSQATKSDKTVESMVEGIAPPLEDESRAELENKLKSLSALPSGISQQAYEAERQTIHDMQGDLTRLEAALKAIPAVDSAFRSAVHSVTVAGNLLKAHVETFPMASCMVCGNDKPNFVGQAGKITDAKKRLAAFITAEESRLQAEQDIANLQAKLRQAVEVFTGREIAVPVDENAKRSIMAQLAADDAARKSWANADAVKKENDQLRSRADLLSIASSALEKAGKQWLEKRKQDFIEAVNLFLPVGETLGVDLETGRFGLMRDGELHSALSGAEWSRVLLALAAAQEKDGSTPCVLVPEDRAWDPVTLERVMTALSVSTVQVIIMSTVAPPGPVEGWTCIQL